jgi:hypothetical protein
VKPDAYIRFRPGDYFPAVEGWSREDKWSYWKAIVYYRCHNHCRGLEDEDEFLRRLCECEPDKWPKLKALIFDNDQFFMQDENGLWHQKCAEDDWREDSEAYDRAVKRSASALKTRWNGKHK